MALRCIFTMRVNSWKQQGGKAFPLIKNHVLLPFAGQLEQADQFCRQQLSDEIIDAITDLIPEEWLEIASSDGLETEIDLREAYSFFLKQRRDMSAIFIKEANHARADII